MESRKMNNSCDTNDAYKADGFDLIQEKLNSSNSFRNSGFQIFRDSGLHRYIISLWSSNNFSVTCIENALKKLSY